MPGRTFLSRYHSRHLLAQTLRRIGIRKSHHRVFVLVTAIAVLVFAAANRRLISVHASIPALPPLVDPNVTSFAPAPEGGFWIQKQEDQVCPPNCAPSIPGHTFTRDNAPAYKDVHHAGSIAWAPGTNGYWVVTPRGEIQSRGGAPELCNGSLSSCSDFTAGPLSVIVAVAAAPNGRGLWAVGYDGKVWTAGEATSYGDAQGSGARPTGIAATATGRGYCISISDGGVYCRGDAPFYGSFAGERPGGHDLTGIAFYFDEHAQVKGYWLVGEDGGIFRFGDIPFWGSSGGNGHRVASMASFPQPSYGSTHPRTTGYGWVDDSAHLSVVWAPETGQMPDSH